MTWCSSIQKHYEEVWGLKASICFPVGGRLHELPLDFKVLRFDSSDSRGMRAYATCCMSQPDDVHPIELHMFSKVDAIEIPELLTVTAHFHRTAQPLNLGHTVFFGKPWLDKSPCQYGLISLPYLDGPSLEILNMSSKTVRFFWLIPVTKAEVEYKKLRGLEKLEERFEHAKVNYLDPIRESVV